MNEELLMQFHEAVRKLRKMKKNDVFDGQLYRSEFFLLVGIEEWCLKNKCDGVKPSKLAEMAGLSMSAASKQIKAVEDKGYIKRRYCQSDKRVVFITLSQKGEELLEKAKADRNKDIVNVIEKMGEDKISQFIGLVNEIYAIMNNEEAVSEKNV